MDWWLLRLILREVLDLGTRAYLIAGRLPGGRNGSVAPENIVEASQAVERTVAAQAASCDTALRIVEALPNQGGSAARYELIFVYIIGLVTGYILKACDTRHTRAARVETVQATRPGRAVQSWGPAPSLPVADTDGDVSGDADTIRKLGLPDVTVVTPKTRQRKSQ